jgi:hypothetical protein
MRIDEDLSKTFTLLPYGQNDVLQSYDLPVTLALARHTCPHYFAGAGAGAGAARYLSNQRTMAANIS